MRDVMTELKELRLHGMSVAWKDLMARTRRQRSLPDG